MHIAIVDDRQSDQQELYELLTRYIAQRRLQAEFTRFVSAEAFLACAQTFDIVFLDIYMSAAQMSGMQAAHLLYERSPSTRIIFCTSSYKHAVESYAVHAAYYLTKPLDYARVCSAMDTSCASLLADSLYLTVHLSGVEAQVLLKDILFADCVRECTRVHLAAQMLSVEDHVGDVIASLCEDERFLCCNRNVVVNMDWIAKVQDGDFLLRSGDSVPIRQRGRSATKKEYLTYALKSLRREAAL